MKTRYLSLVLGVLFDIALGGTAIAAGITATRSTQPVYVDGSRINLTAYNIDGSNYVKLRDIGQAVDMNVYWDGRAVQIDTNAPYTGEAPATQQESAPVTAVTTASQDVEAIRQDIVDRTNAVRIANGQKSLPSDPMVMRAAQVRAEEMAATGCYSHNRPDGSSRLTTTDCPYASENICRIWQNNLDYRGVGLAEQSVKGWSNSPGHFQNMTENSCCAIGVGVAKGLDSFGEECWYCVQWFLRDGYTVTWVDAPRIP